MQKDPISVFSVSGNVGKSAVATVIFASDFGGG
jgi:hypothetical protein